LWAESDLLGDLDKFDLDADRLAPRDIPHSLK
jgi:hypothetical protein